MAYAFRPDSDEEYEEEYRESLTRAGRVTSMSAPEMLTSRQSLYDNGNKDSLKQCGTSQWCDFQCQLHQPHHPNRTNPSECHPHKFSANSLHRFGVIVSPCVSSRGPCSCRLLPHLVPKMQPGGTVCQHGVIGMSMRSTTEMRSVQTRNRRGRSAVSVWSSYARARNETWAPVENRILQRMGMLSEDEYGFSKQSQ